MPAPSHPASRTSVYRQAVFAGWVGLGVNLGLGLVKLIASQVTESMALLSDAVNSLGDALTSIVVLAALRFAQLPPDREHPYGHARAESIAATNVALLVVLSALWVGGQAIEGWSTKHAAPPLWAVGLALANVIIKESLFRYKLYVGRKTGSTLILAGAWDHRGDALCSMAVAIGLTAVRWGGPNFSWADDAAALVVVVGIAWNGTKLFIDAARDLMDMQADGELLEHLRGQAEQVPGVRGIETLLVRKSGLEYLADIHVEVDSDSTVAAGHAIGHAVKDALLAAEPRLRDVLVHIEPYPHLHLRG